jgi:hypothetical protein
MNRAQQNPNSNTRYCSEPYCPEHNIPAKQQKSAKGNFYWKCQVTPCENSYEILNPQNNSKRGSYQSHSGPEPYAKKQAYTNNNYPVQQQQRREPSPVRDFEEQKEKEDLQGQLYRLLIDRLEKLEENQGNWSSTFDEIVMLREQVTKIDKDIAELKGMVKH